MMKIACILLFSEIKPAILAAKTLKQKNDYSLEICLKTQENLTTPYALDEFVSFAKKSDIVLMHLSDGKKSFPSFDHVASILSDLLVPFFASDVQFDPEIILSSTVDKEDYKIIHEYIKSGGVENYENLLYFLANHFADGDFEVNPPEPVVHMA
jgi:cobalamin biosynthesis Mg chelatase CobN